MVEKSEFKTGSTTGLFLIFIAIYGFISLLSNRISFNWEISLGIILIVFIIELIVDLLKYLINNEWGNEDNKGYY